ncbi:MAG: sigma 54-interacting transcriptional regulator [Archangiaceae bacterium]|nr:sigma 54-interacting transcriptional regulator [Archangiaceae bacterium]
MQVDRTSTATLTLRRERGAEQVVLPNLQVHLHVPGQAVAVLPVGLEPVRFGTDPGCEGRLTDPHVSRLHCELVLTEDGPLLRDLGSKNGTRVAGLSVRELILPQGVEVALGAARFTLELEQGERVRPLSADAAFGGALGRSVRMRALFAELEAVARTDIAVVLLGESGTGKELLARGLHARSPRSAGPFVVFDCASVSAELLPSELFGHQAGAFTGARTERAGLLEEAHRGTLLLDQVGELPLALQATLLRALEQRTVRRLGASGERPADVRAVCAAHHDLRAAVEAGNFRKDLYYRLAGVELRVPPLRERRDDIAMLVERFLDRLEPSLTLADLPPHTLALLHAHAWPGNVRELHNVVRRLALAPELDDGTLFGAAVAAQQRPAFLEAREQVLATFERGVLADALERHQGNVSGAARELQVSRQFLHKLIARYGLNPREP